MKSIPTQTRTYLGADIFLKVVHGQETHRPPVWLMRQAGRILPEYRALREKLKDFKELVSTPELAAEATLQPIDALGVDAAILFSDILVIPEAMGLDYEMIEKSGPFFTKTIKTNNDVAQLLSGEAAAARLDYVFEAAKIVKRELAGRVPLIGFAGAPWTILAYMVEGKGSKTFSVAKKFLYKEPELAHQLLQKITDTTIAYWKRKVLAGADVVQLFDSWAGVLSLEQYRIFCLPYLMQITNAMQGIAPVTIFAKGAWFALEEIAQTNCHVIGLDWNIDPEFARKTLGNKQVLQGNLDPCLLYADFQTIRLGTQEMLKKFGQHHIANLGHGVYPDTPLDAVRCFVDTVKEFSYENA